MILEATARPAIKVSRSFVAAFLASVLMLSLAPTAPALSEDVAERTTRIVSVIVQGFNSSAEAREAVESVGGTVTRDLSIVKGVSAEVSVDALSLLEANSSIFQVTPNDKVGFHGSGDESGITHRIQKVVRADKGWSAGITGRGVTVGLLDTGVYNHPDLAGRVVCGADLTAEAGTAADCQDTFGHGTFMAGLIAGDGASSNGKYKGAAPEARIVSVKASGYDGSTDVSTILAGIQWFVAFKDQYDIRVLNLSLGSDSAQDYRLSPLNYAVERAWDAGIAVVVSAGNSGPDSATVMKPGDDPFVITVGSSNDEGSMSIGDDMVPVFSSRGPTRSNGLSKPDVVSPGVHTVSLRSPGSAIDNNHGSTAVVDGSYFRGTGTSMSTATVSGAVAQMLQRNPSLKPDEVKMRLKATARDIAESDPHKAGAGVIDAYAAATQTVVGVATQVHPRSTGLGSLALDRGSLDVEVVTPIGQVALLGEFNAQTDPAAIDATNPAGLVPFIALNFTQSGWDGSAWRNGEWDGSAWRYGDWEGSAWRVGDWAGSAWRGSAWRATVWDGSAWRGSAWRNGDWEGSAWRDESWDGSAWRFAEWDGSAWRASSWQSRMYAAGWE